MKDEHNGSCNVTSGYTPSRMDNLQFGDESKVWGGSPSRALPEFSSTWGDFESFNEFTPDSEQFHYPGEELSDTLSCDDIPTSEGEECSDQQDPYLDWDTLIPVAGDTKLCEKIFRICFPEIPLESSGEVVRGLSQYLPVSDEECITSKFIKLHTQPECPNSERSEGLTIAPPQCDWKNTLSCKNLAQRLGMDTSQKCLEGDQTSNDREEHPVNESWHPPGNTSLIQTKLHTFPHSKQGHIFSYQLFLKKSTPEVTLPFLSFAGKKSFFNTNHFGFNF